MPAREALLPHLATTLDLAWDAPPAPLPALLRRLDEAGAGPDPRGVDAYLREHELPAHADPARARRLLGALARARGLADAAAPLDWPLLLDVQAELLGRPVAFREADAWARGGAERYRWFEGIEGMFARKVRLDAADGCHPLLQAVRLYLDVCFFHPFPDGNARAALVWFEFLLRRAGLPTPPLLSLLRLRPLAGRARRYWSFAALAAGLAASCPESGRRRLTTPAGDGPRARAPG